MNIKDIKHGLMVLDPSQQGEMLDILHFVGYWDQPTQQDADNLREELRTDESFGLTEIADKVVIIPAPDYIVEEFITNIDESDNHQIHND